MLNSPAVPPSRFRRILRNTAARFVHHSEVNQCRNITLLGRHAVISHRFGRIQRDASALRIQHTECSLCLGRASERLPTEPPHGLVATAPPCCPAIPDHGLLDVLRDAAARLIPAPENELRRDMPLRRCFLTTKEAWARDIHVLEVGEKFGMTALIHPDEDILTVPVRESTGLRSGEIRYAPQGMTSRQSEWTGNTSCFKPFRVK